VVCRPSEPRFRIDVQVKWDETNEKWFFDQDFFVQVFYGFFCFMFACVGHRTVPEGAVFGNHAFLDVTVLRELVI